MVSSHDYSKASEHGALRPVTTGNFPIFKTIRLRDEIIAALTSSTEEDYLLLSGSSVIAALCMLVWMNLHPKVKILLYDRSRRKYVERVLTKQEIRLEIEKTIDQRETGSSGVVR